MKRFIAAVSLAVLASSAVAAEVGKPFEQIDIDRALPNLPGRAPSATVYPFGGSAPYEQLAVDRALPNIPDNGRTQFAATAGDTRSDAEIATDRDAVSPWANDPHFIAPPQ
jgi:opacity protein-like surface antigen